MTQISSQAIVVFGCPARADGSPSRALLRRLELALSLARQHHEAFVIVSGGAVVGQNEASVMCQWLTTQGIDAARIVSEAQALNTEQNALHVAALLAQKPVRRVWLVTDRFHMWRSALLLRLALRREGRFDIDVEPAIASDGKRWYERAGLAMAEFWKLVGSMVVWAVRPHSRSRLKP